MPNQGSCAVYIASCDAYADLWSGFFHCFRKHWPDCPYQVYIGSEEILGNEPNTTSLRSGKTRSWSDSVRLHLEQIREDYVLLMLDDFFLRSRVSSPLIERLFLELKVADGAMLRLLARPPPAAAQSRGQLTSECAPGEPYRSCVQAAIWRRKDLLSMLRPNESIWDWELRSTLRSEEIERPFFAVHKTALPYRGLLFHHVVEKQCWIPCEYVRLRLLGIPCKHSTRPWLSARVFLGLLVAESVNRVLMAIWGGQSHLVRNRIKNTFPKCIVGFYNRWRRIQN
jgi:hypothetical protein